MNTYDYTTASPEEVLKSFGVTSTEGLSREERAKRIKQYGTNEVRAETMTWWKLLLRQFHSPFAYLLLVTALLTFLLKEYFDSAMVLLFVAINTSLGFYQEYKSEKTLRLLRQYLVSMDNILEGGQKKNVPVSSLVPGDIIFLDPGDIIPADMRLIEENNLTIDESVLTGESVLVRKTNRTLATAAKEPFQAENLGFSGTTVATGSGKGIVLTTGRNTLFGKIAALTAETNRVSVLEREIARFSSFILKLVVITLALVFFINIALKGIEGHAVELFLFSVALAVSVIPEALPIVMTFCLSKGAAVLAQNKAVVKRLSAIEDLGGIEILCTDKTGTITENSLTASGFYPEKERRDILFYGCLGSLITGHEIAAAKNSFGAALFRELSPAELKKIEGYKVILELPFDPKRRVETLFVEHGRSAYAITSGAPENVLALCTGITSEEKRKMEDWMEDEGRHGKRVFAIAQKKVSKKSIRSADKSDESELSLVGIVSFLDPLKSTTKDAIERAREIGVAVKILTGDSARVAGAVAHEIGLAPSPENVITGEAFEKMTEDEKETTALEYNVFARVSPEQKYDIIRILQKTKNVGFLGEGINDAAALKTANVALVVSGASDIAREAADIILLQKSLSVIITSIEEGRKVFANTVKYIRATLSSNFGNFYSVAIASLLIDFLPMLPLQILLVNLLSDFPMIAISTDNVDKGELRRPKSYNFREIMVLATVLGIVSTVFDFIYFALFFHEAPAVLQTSWFIGSIATELFFIYSIRTQKFFLSAVRPSFMLSSLTLLAFLLTLTLPYTQVGQTIFQFIPPTYAWLTIIIGIAVAEFVTTEIVKLLYYRFGDKKSA